MDHVRAGSPDTAEPLAAQGPRLPDERAAAADDPATLRRAMDGVRALVLDADGVLVRVGAPIPGSMAALARLDALGIPYRIVTNFSSAHRETLAARFSSDGMTIGPERIVSAASAAASYTALRHAGRPLLVLSAPDALREFDGQRLVHVSEVDALEGGVAAVVVGDAGDDLPFGHLDVAFRAVRRGAELVAMHRNPWWQTRRGETLDSGAIVAGLEYATGRRAVLCGKPSRVVFRQAVRSLAGDLGLRRLPAGSVAMVGDDLVADVQAAQRAGLRGVLVLTGKHGPRDVATLAGRRSGTRPDAIAPSLAGLVGALD